MSCYFIAQISVHDSEEYQKYLDGYDTIFDKYQGKVVAVDDSPTVLEGDLKHRRIVLIRFPNEDELRRWYESDEYQSLAQHRKNASEADIILAHGRG